MRFRRLSPASVIATLALVFALGGSAFAAKHYIITSTGQIKPSVVKKLRGKRGAPGPQGPAGPSALSTLITIDGPKVSVPAHEAGSSIATCPAGSRAVSGGGSAITGQGNGLAASMMSADHGNWFTVVGNTSSIAGETQAVVYCSIAGQAVASSREDPSRGTIREVKALEAKIEVSLKR
jgi:hypothetical protein